MLNGELQVFWQPSLQEGVLKNNQPLRYPKTDTKNIFFLTEKKVGTHLSHSELTL